MHNISHRWGPFDNIGCISFEMEPFIFLAFVIISLAMNGPRCEVSVWEHSLTQSHQWETYFQYLSILLGISASEKLGRAYVRVFSSANICAKLAAWLVDDRCHIRDSMWGMCNKSKVTRDSKLNFNILYKEDHNLHIYASNKDTVDFFSILILSQSFCF